MENHLATVQGKMETATINLTNFQKEVETFKALHDHLKRDEEYWRLKSRNNWLKARYRNTNFFHK